MSQEKLTYLLLREGEEKRQESAEAVGAAERGPGFYTILVMSSGTKMSSLFANSA